MNTHPDEKAVQDLLTAYANAVNAGDIKSISSFYTSDGLLMADGVRTFTRRNLEKKGGNYLKKAEFHLDLTINDVKIDGSYAFVQTTAETNSRETRSGQKNSKTSRDLFVLQKEQQSWKIYCYMFNNVNQQ